MTRGTINALQTALRQDEKSDGEPLAIEMTMSDDAVTLIQKLTFSPLQNS